MAKVARYKTTRPNLELCTECGALREVHQRNPVVLCKPCYMRENPPNRTKAFCESCYNWRPIVGRQMCRSCYDADRYQRLKALRAESSDGDSEASPTPEGHPSQRQPQHRPEDS
jgi:hypothetical protein